MTIISLDRVLLLKLLCCVTIFLFFSCTGERPDDIKTQEIPETRSEKLSEELKTKAPSKGEPYYIEIVPADASRNSTLNLIPKGFNLSDAKIEWLVNGNPVRNPVSNQFKTSEVKKRDKVQARAIIEGKEILSNIVKIKNTPPEISRVKIMPEVFKRGDNLYVEVSGSDLDDDAVTILYEWIKNGESVGNSNRIEVPLKKGDKVSIKITPFDGEDYGRTVILHREIRNMPPMIIENKDFDFDGRVYSYQVKAEDPDGDSLTFSLKSSPTGMVIDSSTGLIRWDVPPETRGKHNIAVSVTDGHGGEAIQSFSVEMMPAR